jgi:hypothetical protein
MAATHKRRSSIPLRASSGQMDGRTARLWADLHEKFRRAALELGTPSHFEALRSVALNLRSFSSADRLLGYLAQDVGADLEAKNGIYADLVRCAQDCGPVARLAQTILWLGFWPGLAGAVSRRAWMWRGASAEVIAEVTGIFTGLVARMDLTRVHNVIATLVRSTERDLIRAGPASRKNSTLMFVADIDQLPAEYLVQHEIAVPTAEHESLQLALAEAVRGREGDPVIQSLVLGLGAKHVMTALGIKAPAARKRLERARRRLRAILKIEAPTKKVRAHSAGRAQTASLVTAAVRPS